MKISSKDSVDLIIVLIYSKYLHEYLQSRTYLLIIQFYLETDRLSRVNSPSGKICDYVMKQQNVSN